MAYETKDMTGSLFRNDRKERDTHPDRTGKAMIDGREFYLNGWLKKDRNGNDYLSLSFKPVEQAARREPRTAHAAANRGGSAAALDDDIPFGPEWR